MERLRRVTSEGNQRHPVAACALRRRRYISQPRVVRDLRTTLGRSATEIGYAESVTQFAVELRCVTPSA
jgi:hypothetical protein